MPLLDTVRLRANIQRAGLKLSVAGFMAISLVVAAVLTVGGAVTSGRPVALLLIVPALFAA